MIIFTSDLFFMFKGTTHVCMYLKISTVELKNEVLSK